MYLQLMSDFTSFLFSPEPVNLIRTREYRVIYIQLIIYISTLNQYYYFHVLPA